MSQLKVIGVGGAPGVGKTTLMYTLIGRLGAVKMEVRLGLCRGLYFYPPHNVYVLGIYDGSLFSGTDKLSMAAQPDCVKFLHWVGAQAEKHQKRTVVLFEGDRLFTESFISACLLVAPRSNFHILRASDKVLEERRQGRKLEQQNAQWVRGRVTKVRNLEERFELPHTFVDGFGALERFAQLLHEQTNQWLSRTEAVTAGGAQP